ncbi:MAG TPA: FecR domain-containing protein [Kofleriaceae bacterium]|jgi:TolA-binding protein|nr:FecR domain-containing protein [Kofleriaceae bacterium]
MTCPGELDLARAQAGDDPAIAAHLEACASCRAAWNATRALIELARELPVALPPPARREEVRTAVLAGAAGLAHRPARRAWRIPALATTAAAAAIAGYAGFARPPAVAVAHAHGTVRPRPGARYLVRSTGPDEVVRLDDGVIDVEVEPLHPGERFRVEIGDAELEVRGTAFTVAASAEHLVEVAVAHGRVDVVPALGAPTTLQAGQSWRVAVAAALVAPAAPVAPATSAVAPVAPAASAVAPARVAGISREAFESPAAAAPRSSSPRAAESHSHRVVAAAAARREPELPPAPPAARREPDPPPAPAPTPRAPEEVSYDDAWTALRGGDFSHAAGGFARVVLLAPDGPLGEDASFWRAVALARGRRSLEAVAAFHDFLDGYARSSRTGEASAMLGWLLIDARAFDEAERRFQAAAGDPDPAIRRSARAGLDALAGRKR